MIITAFLPLCADKSTCMGKETTLHTKLLFKENVYLRSCRATIIDIVRDKKGVYFISDQTVFFPTGGGQSCDVGEADGIPVTDVWEEEGVVYHRIDTDTCPFSPGSTVSMQIDWHRRFDNMQRHCGEHVLSGAFYSLYRGHNRGFHMGKDYMTIDIALDEDSGFQKITDDMAREAELRANEVIWADLPVSVHHFNRRSDAEELPLRKALAFDTDISIVTIGDENAPADCVACCGTHPSSSGQIGIIKIYKVEKNKDMFRVYFEAGKRAFRQYQHQFDVITELGNRLSAGTDDLLKKFLVQQKKSDAVRDQLYHLKKEIVARETVEIEKDPNLLRCRRYSELSLDDLNEIGKKLSGKIDVLLFLVHQPTCTVLLFSDTCDCGGLVKGNARLFNGKGGGSKKNARAVFTEAESLQRFIDHVSSQLQADTALGD